MVDEFSSCNNSLKPDLIEKLRILAAQHRQDLIILLEEAIHDLLRKYDREKFAVASKHHMKRDRRQYSRIEVSWQVIMLTSKQSIDAEIKNISIGGALIICNEIPESQEFIELKIQLPNSKHTIWALIEQIRLNINDSDSSLYSYDMAVRFVDLSEDERKILSKAIKREAQMQEGVQSVKVNDYESAEHRPFV